MQLNTYVQKIKPVYLIGFLVLLITVGFFYVTFFYNQPARDNNVVQEEFTSAQQVYLSNKQTMLDKAGQVSYQGIVLQSDFSDQDTAKINQDSAVIKITNGSLADVNTVFNNGVFVESSTKFTGSFNKNYQFLPDYIAFLNSRNPTLVFTLKQANTQYYKQGELHAVPLNSFEGEESVVEITTYNLFVNDYPFVDSNGFSRVVETKPISDDDGAYTVSIPLFIPTQADIVDIEQFSSGTYNLKPIFDEGGEFYDYVAINGVIPTAQDFLIVDNTPTLVYFFSSPNYIVPLASKKAQLNPKKFGGIQNKVFYISNF